MLHQMVETILKTATIPIANGNTVQAHSHIPRDECELLYRQVLASKATQAVEVGMAFGVSTLCLCDGLRKNAASMPGKTPKLVVMDPAQRDATWQGIGIQQVEAAGFGDIVEFYEKKSQDVLPELVRRGFRARLAFIDGWHTLVDFFYVDQLLEVGGVVVFDDVGYPAINAVIRFVLANRAYELVEALRHETAPRPSPAKRLAKQFFRRLARTDKDPTSEHQRLFVRLEGIHSVALRKVGDDDRRWDHYRPF